MELSVNGKTLRYTTLHKKGEETDLSKPVITHRPPSGAGLSQDNIVYKDLEVIGWVKWQPAQRYDVKATKKAGISQLFLLQYLKSPRISNTK